MTEEAKPNTEAGNAEENASAGNMKWYTIHVYSSMEKSAYNALVDRISHSEYKDLFGEVLLPTEKVEDIRNGRKVTTERRLYPGYIFIQMIMNDDTWHLVKNTPVLWNSWAAIARPAFRIRHCPYQGNGRGRRGEAEAQGALRARRNGSCEGRRFR